MIKAKFEGYIEELRIVIEESKLFVSQSSDDRPKNSNSKPYHVTSSLIMQDQIGSWLHAKSMYAKSMHVNACEVIASEK